MLRKLAIKKIDAEQLKKLGLVSSSKKPIKVLGKGDIKTKLTLEVTDFSKSAQQKIEAAGGTITKVYNTIQMSKFTDTFRNIFKIHELRQRIIYTLALLVIVRLGSHLTIPGVDSAILSRKHEECTNPIICSAYLIYLLVVLFQMQQYLHWELCLTFLPQLFSN